MDPNVTDIDAIAFKVVSGGKRNRERDLKEKRVEYALAKIKEYWIIDPKGQKITVLVLEGKSYRNPKRRRGGKPTA